jgi:hypothetical protein
LTCTYSGDEPVISFTWQLMKKIGSTSSNIGIITADCKPFILPVDSNVYEYNCPSNTQYTWKIKKVTRQNEGDNYQCTVDTPTPGVIVSNNVIVSILGKNVFYT